MKRMWILLFTLAAVTVLMVACGRNRNDADTNSVQHTEQHETDRTHEETTHSEETDRAHKETTHSKETDRGGIMDDAEDMVSDVIKGGEEIVSDAADEGRDIVSGIAGTDESTETTETETSR